MEDTKFKVGDRVAVYSLGRRCVGTITEVVANLSILGVEFDALLNQRLIPERYFSEKQCRKLVKKKPPRTFFINIYSCESNDSLAHKDKKNADLSAGPTRIECIEVREVRRKKK